MAEVFLRRLSRWQAEQQREAFADAYVESYRGTAGEEFGDRQGFLRRFEDHVQQPEFDMVVAEGTEPIGCAYGFRVHRSGTWWQDVREHIPTDLAELTASGQVFVMAGMMVLPSYRRRGTATRLQERLLERSTAARVVALVGAGNTAARAACRSWSWTNLGDVGPGSAAAGSQVWSRLLPP